MCNGAIQVQRRRNEIESAGHIVRRKPPEKFFCRAPSLFGSTSTMSRFGEIFRDGPYSLVSFLFDIVILTIPPCPSIVKVGNVPPVPHGVGATAQVCVKLHIA